MLSLEDVQRIAHLARIELDEAERKLLMAQSGLEWAQSQVQYETARVTRLSGMIATSARRIAPLGGVA